MKYSITLQGIERFLDSHNESGLFDLIDLPEGINKGDLIVTIFRKCQDLELVNSDPWSLQLDVKSWFATHYDSFDRWVTALAMEYNPLENYDRQENWRDDHTFQNNNSSSESGGGTIGNTRETKNMQTAYNSTNETDRAAFNSNSYENYEKVTHGGNDTVNGKVIDDGTNTFHSNSSENNNGTDAGVHSGRVHGNIGVTTSQQMLESEIKLRYFNIYDAIAELFKEDFCILIY